AFPDMKPGAPDPKFALIPDAQRGRAAAFAPGGGYARMLANRPLLMKVGDTVFVHGGILPKHVAYGLDKMVDEVAAWMRGERPSPPEIVVAEDGPIWMRAYSDNPGPTECAMLSSVLGSLGAKRMVMGHTVQKGGVTSACDGKAWRIDVGLAHVYGGPTQELEVAGEAVVVKK
ncbi:MAG: calcineurin, partial [Polyangiales bacterium]